MTQSTTDKTKTAETGSGIFEPNAYEYRLVEDGDAEAFEEAVNAALEENFQPLGRLRIEGAILRREFYRRKDSAASPPGSGGPDWPPGSA